MSAKPVIIVASGVLSASAKTALRRAGHVVVEATDPEKVKRFYPDTFNEASARAKILAFDYLLESGPNIIDRNDIRKFYVHYLRELKAF